MTDDDARDRKARLAAQFDQVDAEGRGMVNDPEFAAALGSWQEATRTLTRVLMDVGIPREGLLSALLGPTAEIVIEVRGR